MECHLNTEVSRRKDATLMENEPIAMMKVTNGDKVLIEQPLGDSSC